MNELQIIGVILMWIGGFLIGIAFSQKFLSNERKSVRKHECTQEVCDYCNAPMIPNKKEITEWVCPNSKCITN